MRVHRKALSLQGKRASLLVEAILMSGSMLMWGVIVPTAVGHAWYQGQTVECVGGENLGQLPLLWVCVVYWSGLVSCKRKKMWVY